MKKISVVDLRQAIGRIIASLNKTGEPILLQMRNKPAAVIISLEDFRTRFVEKDADERRKAIAVEIKAMRRKAKDKSSAEDLVRNLREG